MKKLLKRRNVKNEIECNKNIRTRKRTNVVEKKTRYLLLQLLLPTTTEIFARANLGKITCIMQEIWKRFVTQKSRMLFDKYFKRQELRLVDYRQYCRFLIRSYWKIPFTIIYLDVLRKHLSSYGYLLKIKNFSVST